jgi:uncharacterized protein (TIGR02147 family)
MLKIARHLKMHTSRVSHIFRGEMNLTLEQACALGRYFGLSSLESEYFLTLVNLERAGSEDLRDQLRRQADGIRARAQEFQNRVPPDKTLTEEQKAVFYSSWLYSGIRLATSIPQMQTVDAIAAFYQIPREKVRGIIDFLLATGLCVEEDGRIAMGPKTTHLEKTSPLVLRHHTNWRLKAISRYENLSAEDLVYSCPVSLRAEDQVLVREMILQFIERFLKKIVTSDPAENVACLNIDWFTVKKDI